MTKKKEGLSVDQRWRRAVPHDLRSIALYDSLAKIDAENDNDFDFKSGGDGDNGESLMYLLDIHFAKE